MYVLRVRIVEQMQMSEKLKIFNILNFKDSSQKKKKVNLLILINSQLNSPKTEAVYIIIQPRPRQQQTLDA